ncbi:MAG: hypothetical protein AAF430_25755 [Myxococcota bacterium]
MRWVLLGVLALLALYVAAGRAAAPFHGDESTFLWMSRDYDTLVHGSPVQSLPFSEAPADDYAQWLRVLNGSLHPLSIGLARETASGEAAERNAPWIWEMPAGRETAQWRFNLQTQRLPNSAALAHARWPATLATLAAIFACGFIGRRFYGGSAAGIAATLVLATTPAVLLNGRRALQEGGLLLFSFALLGAGLWVVTRACASNRATPPLPALLGLGALAGLAVAMKHSLALGVGVVWIWGLVAGAVSRPAASERAGLPSAIAAWVGAGFVALGVFGFVVPVWWSPARHALFAGLALAAFGAALLGRAPRSRAVAMIGLGAVLVAGTSLVQPAVWSNTARVPATLAELRTRLLDRQATRYENHAQPGSRIAAVVRESLGTPAQYYEDPAWVHAQPVLGQIERYERLRLGGRGGSVVARSGVALLCVAGLVAAWTRRRDPAQWLLLAWWLAPALALLANALPWQRYYLVLQPAVALLAGQGAGWLLVRLRERNDAGNDAAEPASANA